MKDVLDAIIYYDELSRDQQIALRNTLAAEPELLLIFNRWQQIKGEIRKSIDKSIPDREQLVLFALQQNKETYLTPEEIGILETSSNSINNVLYKHPGLTFIIDDIKRAQSDFLQIWSDLSDDEPQYSNATKIFPRNTFKLFPHHLSRIAAVFIVACLTFYSAFTFWQNQRIETIRSENNTFRTVQFEDGSKVRLVGASELTYAKSGLLFSFDREVKLAGQAYFDISPNKEPFVVESATALTQATGTQFSIDAQPTRTEVVLTSGLVSLQSKDVQSVVTLSPGERSMVLLGEAPSLPEQIINMTDQLSWTGLFIFHYSPLSAVASYLGAHFDAQIDVEESLKQEQFKASFDPDTLSLNEALATLSIAFDAQIDTLNSETNTYLLSPFTGE